MTSGITARRFPVRLKATFPKAASGDAIALNMKPVLCANHNKIIPFPTLPCNITKTKAAILNFPVRA